MEKKRYAYIVDSSIVDDPIISEENNVYKVFFNITDSENNEYEDNGNDLKTQEILDKQARGVIFQTSAVSVGKLMIAIEDIIDKYDEIVVFTISSGLSSYYNNVMYLEEEDDYQNKVHIIDTKEVGFGMLNIVKQTKNMLENENKTIEEVKEYVANAYKNNFTMFSCESWTPLAKSGRAPKMISAILNKVNTKPIIRFDIENKLGGIARGFNKSVEKIFKIFVEEFKNPALDKIEEIVFYNNFLREERATYIRNSIQKILGYPINKIKERTIPNIVLLHTGIESFGIHIRVKN